MSLLSLFRRKVPSATPPVPLPVYHDAEFDIEHLPVMGIERDTERDLTVIGHMSGGTYSEYVLPVSPEAHRVLVARFRAKIGAPVDGYVRGNI